MNIETRLSYEVATNGKHWTQLVSVDLLTGQRHILQPVWRQVRSKAEALRIARAHGAKLEEI